MEFDHELAIQGKYELEKICNSLENDLNEIKGKSEDADAIWRNLQLYSIWRDYEIVFRTLKEKRYYEAWCLIEQVLIENTFLLKNFPEDKARTDFVSSHLIQLQMLFPYKIFMSTVLRVKEEVCSICGCKISPWSDCGHIPGKIYKGELCVKVVKSFDFLGADIVMNPEHKYAVMFASDGAGKQIDIYDYSSVEKLLEHWKTPFQDWEIIREVVYTAPAEDIKDTDPCPCMRSFANYADCCKKRPGILTYKYIIRI